MAGFIDRIREGAEKAAFEADRLRRLTGAQSELRGLIRRLETDTTELGKRVLALHDSGALTQSELQEDCKAINAVRQEIADKEHEVQRIRQEKPPEAPRAAAFGHICPNCKIELPDEAMFCHQCGSRAADVAPPPPAEARVCSRCGAGLQPEAAFCPECGARVEAPAAVPQIACPHCWASIPAEAVFCPECGQSTQAEAEPALAKLAADEAVLAEEPTVLVEPGDTELTPAAMPLVGRACARCGAAIPGDAVFCPECGQFTAVEAEPALDQWEEVEVSREEEELPPEAPTVLVQPEEDELTPTAIPLVHRTCSHCGAAIPGEAVFCPECGQFAAIEAEPVLPEAEIAPEEELFPEEPTVLVPPEEDELTPAAIPLVGRTCSHCGSAIPQEAVFCPECGQYAALEAGPALDQWEAVEVTREEEELPPEAPTVLVQPEDDELTPAAMPLVRRTCFHCGAAIPGEAVFCPECGHYAPLEAEPAAVQWEEEEVTDEAEELPPEAPTVLVEPEEDELTPAAMPLVGRTCFHCGAAIPGEAVFCPECGQFAAIEAEPALPEQEIPPDEVPAEAPAVLVAPDEAEPTPDAMPIVARTCSQCGAPIPYEAVFCPECGQLTALEAEASLEVEPEEAEAEVGKYAEPLEEELLPEAPTVLAGPQESKPTPAESTCPHCGSPIPEESDFCPECGQSATGEPSFEAVDEDLSAAVDEGEEESIPLPGETLRLIRCPACRAGIPGDVELCPVCGHSLIEPSPPALDLEAAEATAVMQEKVAEPDVEPEELLGPETVAVLEAPDWEPPDAELLDSAATSCPFCLGLIDETDLEFCPHCGQPLIEPHAEPLDEEDQPQPTQGAESSEFNREPASKAEALAALTTCPHCLGLVRVDAGFCPTCGKPLEISEPDSTGPRSAPYGANEPDFGWEQADAGAPEDDTLTMMGCPSCRATIPAMATFCPECGARLT